MEPLILYPQKWRLGVAIVGGLFLASLGQKLVAAAQGDVTSMIVPGAIILAGLALVFLGGRALITNRPSFAADPSGFSVMGKSARPWSEFIDARPVVVRYGILPIGSYLAVRVKRGLIPKKHHITLPFMSGSAREMAAQINAYSQLVAMQHVVDGVISGRAASAPAPRPEAVPAPTDSETAPGRQAFPPLAPPAADGGPIQSNRRFSERLFGRKSRVL